MSSELNLITTPVGRLVEGSLYVANTKDHVGNLLVTRSGPDLGKPRIEYFIALAIPKGPETHWAETKWGNIIWTTGHNAFKNGEAKRPDFAWKIIDGDSDIPNSNQAKPCDKEGFAGHWVVKFKNGFAPVIVNNDGSQVISQVDYVNLGDYVQVGGFVQGNAKPGTPQPNPGVFLNLKFVAFQAYGSRIIKTISPNEFEFGKDALPIGAKLTPPAGLSTTPAGIAAPGVMPQPTLAPLQPAAITPYPQILNPQGAPSPTPTPPPMSTPLSPVKVMLPAAGGSTYEQYLAAGWTDPQLIQHGFMQG